MKKILVLATAAFLFSGIAFAHDQGGDKGKGKGKKSQTSGTKSCPGKECGKTQPSVPQTPAPQPPKGGE